MKKNILTVLLCSVLVGSAVFANNMHAMTGFNFAAPTVNGKANVFGPQTGEIVYDSSDANFWGYDQSNNWVQLSGGGSGSSVPPGVMMPFAGISAPAGYLMTDGSAVSRTTYASLFAIIGTAYGVGDGSTTFNLPDTRNVFLRGANASTRTISSITYPAVTLGATSLDKLQGHYHSLQNGMMGPVNQNSNAGSNASGYANSTATTMITDGTNGTPRIGSETAPVNLGVNYIIKY